jgi:hypothetical protein
MAMLTSIEDPHSLLTSSEMRLGSIVTHRYDPNSHGLVVEVFTKNAVKVLWSKYSRKNVVLRRFRESMVAATYPSGAPR